MKPVSIFFTASANILAVYGKYTTNQAQIKDNIIGDSKDSIYSKDRKRRLKIFLKLLVKINNISKFIFIFASEFPI